MRRAPRRVELSTAFRRDMRREDRGRLRGQVQPLVEQLVNLLAVDAPLPPANWDHPLTGEWSGYRDCHVRSDLVLIYRKPDDARLQLARLGSHSELFG
jgi:mRNA interferase YafQ